MADVRLYSRQVTCSKFGQGTTRDLGVSHPLSEFLEGNRRQHPIYLSRRAENGTPQWRPLGDCYQQDRLLPGFELALIEQAQGHPLTGSTLPEGNRTPYASLRGSCFRQPGEAENVSYLDILVDDACLSLEKLRSAIINHPFADPAVVGNAMRELLASGIYYHIERLEQYRQEGSCYRLSCLNESGVYPPSTVFNTLATLHIAAEAVSASLWAGRVSAIAMEEDIAVVEKCMNRVHEAFSLHLGACREKEGIYKAQISNCSIVAILLATVAFSYLVQLPGGLNTKGVSAAYATGGSIRAAFVVFVFFNSSGLVVSLYCVLYPATIGPWVTHQYYKQAERMCHCLYLASSALFAAYLAAVYIAFGVHDFGHFFSSIYIVLFGGGVLFTLILLRRGVVKRLRSFWDVANNPGCLRRFRPVNDQYRNWAGL